MYTGNPFDYLLNLESRCKTDSAGIPTMDQVEEEWVGVGFRIGKEKFLASMNEVEEILDLPAYTNVPGVKSWVVGVANVRGSLLPIMDLKGFVTGKDMTVRRKGRVIVIDYKGVNTGLIVEEVYGMKHFLVREKTEELPAIDKDLSQYVEVAFKQDDEYWPVFSFNAMTRDERFMQASL